MATSNNKQVFDVAKPGKTPPSATSRPVISSHGPVLKDPMVADGGSKPETDSKPAPASRKVITPTSEKETDEKDAATPDNEPAVAETDSEDKDKSKDAKGTDKQGPSEAVMNAVASQAAKRKKAEPTDEEKAQALEIEKLIDEKKYFVPIGAVSRRRRSRILIVSVFILFLAAVTGYLILDAGLIETDISLPLDLIK